MEESPALSGLPIGLPFTAGSQEALNGTTREKFKESLFRLKLFETKEAY